MVRWVTAATVTTTGAIRAAQPMTGRPRATAAIQQELMAVMAAAALIWVVVFISISFALVAVFDSVGILPSPSHNAIGIPRKIPELFWVYV